VGFNGEVTHLGGSSYPIAGLEGQGCAGRAPSTQTSSTHVLWLMTGLCPDNPSQVENIKIFDAPN
jgi:hypothetical protein